MSDIQVSIFGSCNRPHLWKWFYETVAMNTINFEIVFAGNVEPDFKLPDNFKYINTNVKPPQCSQIAANNCSGELIVLIADDCQFSPGGLDILYHTYKLLNNPKYIPAPKFFRGIPGEPDFVDVTHTDCKFDIGTDTPLPAYICGLVPNQAFKDFHGYDTRFVFSFADVDFQLRMLMDGYSIAFCEDVWLTERKDFCPNWMQGISKTYSDVDWAVLRNTWFVGSQFNPKRNNALEPYENNDTILTISQGPSGQWR